jgi:hypothetical protein
MLIAYPSKRRSHRVSGTTALVWVPHVTRRSAGYTPPCVHLTMVREITAALV